MKEFIGVCYVGVNREKTQYVVLRFAKDISNGVSFIYGPAMIVLKEEMVEKGLSIVIQHMRNRPELDSLTLSEAQKIPDKDLLKLKRTHPLVDIELLRLSDGREEIKIMPLHGRRGWRFDAEIEEIQVCQLPMTNEIFMKSLDYALETAT